MFFVPSAILAFIPNPIISQNESWFLSNTEKVHWLYSKLCEVIDKVNTYDEMFAELKDILATFDETVQKAVEDYIHEMFESGDLRDIVEEVLQEIAREYITTMLNAPAKTGTMDFSRLYRHMYYTGENSTDHTNDNTYTFAQGNCYFVRNGIPILAVAYKCSNNSNYRYNNVATIRLYNMTTGQEIASKGYNIGHANSLTYDEENDCLFIAWDYTNPYQTEESQASKNVSKIYIDNLINNVDTIETNTLDVGMEKISTVAMYDGILYCGNRNEYVTYDFDTEETSEIFELTNDNYLTNIHYIQDMTVSDKFIALLSYQPSKIYLYDKESRMLLWAIDIPDYLNQHQYRTLEPEGITLLDDGDIYLVTAGHTAKKDFNALDIMQIFKQNIYFNNIATTNYFAGDRQGRQVEIHCNNSVTYNDVLNPNGTSTNPFKYIQEAIMYAEDNPTISRASFVLHASENNVAIYACSYKSLFFYNETGVEVSVRGFALEGCTDISIARLNITGLGSYAYLSSTSTDAKFDLRHNCIACRNSKIDIANCTFEHNNGVTNAISGGYLFMNYSGDSATTETEFVGESERTFFDIVNSTVNARGKATNNSNVFDPSHITYSS